MHNPLFWVCSLGLVRIYFGMPQYVGWDTSCHAYAYPNCYKVVLYQSASHLLMASSPILPSQTLTRWIYWSSRGWYSYLMERLEDIPTGWKDWYCGLLGQSQMKICWGLTPGMSNRMEVACVFLLLLLGTRGWPWRRRHGLMG